MKKLMISSFFSLSACSRLRLATCGIADADDQQGHGDREHARR